MVSSTPQPPPLSSTPAIVEPPPGPRSRALAQRLSTTECPEVTYLADDFPIFWERAGGCMVEDVDGNTYLDMTAAFAVSSIGHTHPRVVEAIRTQAGTLLHGMGDVHPTPLKVELAEALARVTPGDLGQALFATSGAEAIEAARKSCAVATRRAGLIAFTGAYHGLTYGALEVTARAEFRRPFAAQLAGKVSFAPYPYCYRCPFGRSYPSCELECLKSVERMLDDPASGVTDVGGILLEPIQGRGGIVVPPPEYLPGLRKLCDDRGILLILDEIFTGFCRTGAWFACERVGVVPDLMALGKALGGGAPISACVGTPAVMNRWDRSEGEALHTSTFLGNPLACAAALAALEVMQSEKLAERAELMGRKLLDKLETLLPHHPEIGEIRGAGLMVGIELVEDRQSRRPATGLCVALMKRALGEGLLILPEGSHGNVVGLTPPLVVDEAQLDLAVEVIDRLLRELTREK